ncbi:FecR family protein [uncultured Gimesia sp.]|uniref:FecR family protein n=1 Tax=uncultured Gimesia sp. TaxID=1678688 RepID=UPI0030D73DAB|tara:strand:- start:170967 stop:172334 length:1368 start_codon:yes stop_codon:yes gene_type:complete
MITERSAQWEDPLPKLVALYFDNQLDESKLRLLQERLKSDPEARVFFAQFSALQAQLEWVYTDSPDSQKQTHLPVSFQVAKRNWSQILYAFTCICLVLGGLLFVHLTTPVAHVFPVKGSYWKTGPINDHEPLLSGSHRHLLRGEIEIRFESGSVVNLKAPALFTTNGSNEFYLEEGKVVADVPESGHGFTVDTHAGRIVDLGTSFSVNVGAERNAEIKVYRGKVQVGNSTADGPSHEIRANEAVQIDSVTRKIQTQNYSSSDFIPLISRDYPVLRFSESVVFQEHMPAAIARGTFQVLERDETVFLFPEKRDVQLISDLKVSISQPGKYWSQDQIEKESDVISRGMKVDCYRVYYDPASNQDDMMPAAGEIEFDQPILGIITTNKMLGASDKFLNPVFHQFPGQKIKHQEIEIRLSKDGTRQDVIVLSPDRKKLSFQLFTGTSFVDEFRVLVASP